MIHLTKLTKLTSLNLDSRFITDAAMPAIAAITSLTKLDLFGSRLTDFGARFLGRSSQLVAPPPHLTCSPSLPLCMLGRLTNLRHLESCGGGLTDEGVKVRVTTPSM